MTAKKDNPQKAGAKTKYYKKYAKMAEVACREGGFTDLKLSKLFSVSKATITNWKKNFPEFLASLKKGKDDWDSEKVKNSLLKRATGFSFTEITRRAITKKDQTGDIIKDENGNDKIFFQVSKTVKKTHPPDTGACVVWLTNRKASEWSRNVDQSKSSDKPIPVQVIIQRQDGRKEKPEPTQEPVSESTPKAISLKSPVKNE